MVANPDLFKRVTLNLEKAPHEWVSEHIEECKRLGIVQPKTTMTDVINRGFRAYVEQLKAEYSAAKKRKK